MKKYIKLDDITDSISSCIASAKELTQEQIFCFMKRFMADNGSFFDAEKTKSYKKMRRQLNELWQYREWRDMSSEQAFLYGQLYGCVKLCDYREQNHQDTVWIDFLLLKYADSRLFYIVKKHPGIRHKDLAKEIGLSTGRLSQMMDEEDLKELLISRVLGREKHYFLAAKGEELYRKLEAQKRKAKKAEMQMKKAEMQIKKAEADIESWMHLWNDKIAANTNVNTLPDFYISKTNPAAHWQMEVKKLKQMYCYNNISNELVSKNPMEEEEECLAEKNFYYGQLINHSTNGLLMSSAR